MRSWGLLAVVCLLAFTAEALAAFHSGDIIVAGIDGTSYPMDDTSRIRQFSPSGTLIKEVLS